MASLISTKAFSAVAVSLRAARSSGAPQNSIAAILCSQQRCRQSVASRGFHSRSSGSNNDGAAPRSSVRWSPYVTGTALSLGLFAAFLTYDAEHRKLHFDSPPGARVGIIPVPSPGSGPQRKDPATGTELPESLPSPLSYQGPELRLVGLGVRTVSFLKVRVYVAGVYVDQGALERVRREAGVGAEVRALEGKSTEEVVKALLDAGVPFVIRIVPVRSTDFNHMRDGFTRSVQARLKAARKANILPPAADEDLSLSLQSLKSLFPPSALPKGSTLDLVVHPSSSSSSRVAGKARMALSLEHDGKVLGTLAPPVPGSEASKGGWSVAKELVLAYVADKNEISTPLKQSVAEGMRELLG
ncbi:unnamed protein product [Tilletia controversa]|uniref:Chalcone isomerase domain-containing protein n=3 Tax=Tilletia TaxID=13289 RepID=A0A8X7T0Y0_9BASI|nr:hypothetical protein CF336_g301 [Tilletia laevis]KAE8205307.1 hypothetical protein CF328_g581 [Tilletia controversa]KAE8265306.1 hypothetical protein A4X03_0g354 [Tilletia caries]KAE8208810.1 hypothetical protein CF335_g135 [Tilletia laevis]KAE8255012.1 hypothetical protein A4X06_0g638 [Tilletia controversa]